VSCAGHQKAAAREKVQENLKTKLQAALQDQVSLVERVQALEAERGGLEQRAAELAARLGSCEEELAAARSSGSAEAACMEGRLRECTERMGELEGMLEAGERERVRLEEERAGLAERIGDLEREVEKHVCQYHGFPLDIHLLFVIRLKKSVRLHLMRRPSLPA
jgi:chromosome segregation ATPase